MRSIATRVRPFACIALAFACGGGGAAQAAADGHGTAFDRAPAQQRFAADARFRYAVEWNREDGRVETLRGRSQVLDPDPAAAARVFLDGAAELLELQDPALELHLERRRASPAGTHLTYAQTWRGLPVFNGGIDVHVDADGAVFLAHNRNPGDRRLRELPAAPGVSAASALGLVRPLPGRAADKAGRVREFADAAAPATEPELGVYRAPAGVELAWRFRVGGVRYVLSASTGEVLERTALFQSATGVGTVFDPNPVNTLADATLRNESDTNYAALLPAYRSKTLQGIQQLANPLRYRLYGPYVRAFQATGTFLSARCGRDGTLVDRPPPVRTDTAFEYFRDQGEFEHTMVYYHLDRSQRYIRSLGFLDLQAAGVAVDAHAFAADNSYYCSIGNYLAFGDGGVDDAEDADVVLHEYGHALQEDASGGRYLGNGQAGAMGEGFGDYWAFAAKPAGYRPACFAEWDVNTGGCLRRLDRDKVFPADYVNEVHADGEIWSRGLRELFLALGKEKTNRIVLQSHYLIAASPNFNKGVLALLDADQALYAGADRATICAVMQRRGIGILACGS